MMEDFLTIKNLQDALKGEEVRHNGISILELYKMKKSQLPILGNELIHPYVTTWQLKQIRITFLRN